MNWQCHPDQPHLNRRTVLVAAGIGVAGLVAAACGTGSDDDKKDAGPKKPKVSVAYTPDLASPDAPNPTDEFSVKASKGTFNPDVKLLNPQGVAVKGELSDDRTTYTITEPLGYGATYTAKRNERIAVIACGYADGYPRLLSCGKGIVEIKGMPCPVLGRVCMDQIMVDVSALPDVQEGDEAILWGGEVSDSAETIAHKTDTISYEVLCGVSRRVPRVYLENGGIKAVEDWIL